MNPEFEKNVVKTEIFHKDYNIQCIDHHLK